MSNVNDTLKIAGHELKNRIAFLPVRTFPYEGKNGDGSYHYEAHLEHYTKVAKGGPGLVIVQGTNVKGINDDTYNWTPGSRETLTKIASVIKQEGAVAVIQLSWGGDRTTDINEVSADFIKYRQDELLKASIASYEMGYDGIEIHYGHGLLMARMLDTEQNLRTDCYGGSLENRARVLTEILPEIRKVTGNDFIIAVRTGPFMPTLETGLETMKYFESIGVDLLSVSYCMTPPDIEVPDDFILGPVTYSASLVKNAVNIPVIACWAINNKERIDFVLNNDYADIAGEGRASLADYNFPNAILNDEPYRACLRCMKCFWYTDDASKCPAGKVAKTKRSDYVGITDIFIPGKKA